MGLHWGFSTLGCPDLGLDAVLKLAKRRGFEAVELRFLDGSDDLNASLERYLGVPGNLDKARGSGVRVSALLTSYSLLDSVPPHFESLTATARLADQLGAKYLRVFDGKEFGENVATTDKILARSNYAAWRKWKAANGIRAELALETHGATASTQKTLELFNTLGTSLPIIWDTHHTRYLAGEEVEETWRLLGRDIVEVHVKDSTDRPSDRHPYTYVLPGKGRVPIPGILDLLTTDGFDGYVILEWERKWHPSLPPLEDAIAAMDAADWRKV